MAHAPDTRPVRDWATDYDIFDPDYVRDPAPVWDDLRSRCPIARTERWGGLLDADPLRGPAEAGQDGAGALVALAGRGAAVSGAA